MSKLYLHIGLPKTATTTLQIDLFPILNRSSDYEYIGISAFKPRDQEDDVLYKEFYRSVCSGIDICNTNEELKKRLSKGRSIVLSEEMVVVSSKDVAWQEKLGNLAAVLEGIDYNLLITVREPVSAMFSYYAELYWRYGKENYSWERLSTEVNDFKIFNYELLYFELEKYFDTSDMFTARFEDIVKGDFGKILEFLDNPCIDFKKQNFSRHNSKKSDSRNIYIEKNASLLWLRFLYRCFGGRSNPVLRFVKKTMNPWLKKVQEKPAGYIKIKKPSAVERQYVKDCLLHYGVQVQSRHGINYLQ